MATLNRFRFEWKALNEALNRIADVVNQNCPLEGDHISLSHNGNLGVAISVSAQTKKSPGGDQQSGGGATSIIWYGVKWQDVTMVDPSSCTQSTLTVLTKTGNADDVVVIGVVSG
jgi:hypothetical protein